MAGEEVEIVSIDYSFKEVDCGKKEIRQRGKTA